MKLVEHKVINDFKDSDKSVYLNVERTGYELTYLDLVILLYIERCEVSVGHNCLTSYMVNDIRSSDTVFSLYDSVSDSEIVTSLSELIKHNFINTEGSLYKLTHKSLLIVKRCKLDKYLKQVPV